MKTLKSSLTLILAVLTTITFANTAKTGDLQKENVNLSLNKNTEVVISLENVNLSALSLEVYNGRGAEVYAKSITADEQEQIIHSLTGLSEGFYTYVLKDNNKIIYSASVIKGDECSMEIRNENSSSNASVLDAADNIVKVNIENKDKTKTTLYVKDAEGNSIYSKSVKKAGNFKLSYDISELAEGDYRFEVYHNKSMIACKKIAR